MSICINLKGSQEALRKFYDTLDEEEDITDYLTEEDTLEQEVLDKLHSFGISVIITQESEPYTHRSAAFAFDGD